MRTNWFEDLLHTNFSAVKQAGKCLYIVSRSMLARFVLKKKIGSLGGDLVMKVLEVSLDSTDKVKKFVNAVNNIEGDVVISSGKYIVDAKSILGIFSLDLSKPLKVEITNWKEEYATLLEEYCI